jgi:hypothetical protein
VRLKDKKFVGDSVVKGMESLSFEILKSLQVNLKDKEFVGDTVAKGRKGLSLEMLKS